MTIWQVIQHGFCNDNHAYVWQVSDGICSWCGLHMETIEHLFFTCPIARFHWRELDQLTRGTTLVEVSQSTLFATVAKQSNGTRGGQGMLSSLVRFAGLFGQRGLWMFFHRFTLER